MTYRLMPTPCVTRKRRYSCSMWLVALCKCYMPLDSAATIWNILLTDILFNDSKANLQIAFQDFLMTILIPPNLSLSLRSTSEALHMALYKLDHYYYKHKVHLYCF